MERIRSLSRADRMLSFKKQIYFTAYWARFKIHNDPGISKVFYAFQRITRKILYIWKRNEKTRLRNWFHIDVCLKTFPQCSSQHYIQLKYLFKFKYDEIFHAFMGRFYHPREWSFMVERKRFLSVFTAIQCVNDIVMLHILKNRCVRTI